jgi:hypothetical protein
MESSRKSWADHLAPGVTAVAGLGVLVGLAGVVSSLSGAYQTWLGPIPWVLIVVAAFLLFLGGTALGRSAHWRGGDPLITTCMAVVGVGLLLATGFIALWKNDQQQHDLVRHKTAELASVVTVLQDQARGGKAHNQQLLQQAAGLQKEIDELKNKPSVFSSKEDFEKTFKDQIEKYEAAKPKAELPPSNPTPPPAPDDGKGKPREPNRDQGAGEQQPPTPPATPTPPADPPSNDPPQQPGSPGGSNSPQEAFTMALAAALAAAGLPLGMIMGILGIVGQLFSLGVSEQDAGPIAAIVRSIHEKGGNLSPGEIQTLLEKTRDPKLAAEALQVISQQPLVRERLTPEGQGNLDRSLSTLRRGSGGGAPPPPTPNRKKPLQGKQG